MQRGLTRLTRQVVRADALHCPHCGVKRRDDRSAFFPYYEITDQIKAVNARCARLIEHRAIVVEGNAKRVQEVDRSRASQREYYAIKETSWMFCLSKHNARSSSLIFDFFDV